MSFVIAAPDLVTAAAHDLASIGAAINTANHSAASATTQLLPAAEDEVSAAIAALFRSYGQQYQSVSAQAAAMHTQFLQTLASSANSYASAEAFNLEQLVLSVINAPTNVLLGRPLIGDGADGAPGTGQHGRPGGILWGNGGNGGSGAPGQAGG
ncbi:PE family protein, partial [Mycobacterium intermedium]